MDPLLDPPLGIFSLDAPLLTFPFLLAFLAAASSVDRILCKTSRMWLAAASKDSDGVPATGHLAFTTEPGYKFFKKEKKTKEKTSIIYSPKYDLRNTKK